MCHAGLASSAHRGAPAHDSLARQLRATCQIGTLTVFLALGTESRQHSNMRSPLFGVTRRITWLPAAGVLAALSGNARADADSLNDVLGPREIAMGEVLRGGATGASSIDLNPAGLSLNRELVFEGGYGYRATDSASLVGVSACDSTNAVPGCFFYDYAGSNPDLGGMTMHRTTHVGGLSLSRTLIPRILVGVTAKYFRFSSDMANEPKASGTAFDFGATIRLNELLNIGVSTQNLWSTAESAQFPRAVGGGVYAHVVSSLVLSFDARWRLDGADTGARYGGGAELFLRGDGGQTGYPIRVGALHDNALGATYLSAGLGYTSLRFGIDVAGRREIRGGDETLIVASMRVFGPRFAAPGVE
jgi:hypothetical protein